MSIQFRPLSDRIAIRRIEAEEETSGGIFIPDVARDQPQVGEVLACGPGSRASKTGELIPIGVHVGERVLFGKYAGGEVKIDGQEILIVREDELYGVIEREPLK